MSEFINSELGHCDVVRVEKSPISKNKCDLSCLEGKTWRISSASRGKEMMVKFSCSEESHYMKIGFARIGLIEFYPLDKIDQEVFDRRAMLRFYTADRVYFLSDFTRYAIWRWSSTWDRFRSPDIVLEHNQWRDHLYKHRHEQSFKKPVFEVMGDQMYFNGIGTFTKSEILCRTRFSPFTNFDEILESDLMREDFFQTCRDTLIAVYELGGLQFAHWKNPFNVSKQRFNKWVRCFNKMGKAFFLRDSNDKKFWFEKQWIPEYCKWVDSNEVQDRRLIEKIYSYTSKKNTS